MISFETLPTLLFQINTDSNRKPKSHTHTHKGIDSKTPTTDVSGWVNLV